MLIERACGWCGICGHLLEVGTSCAVQGQAMKSLRFVPLAFVAGVHGFPMFVSYLVVVVTAVHVARLFKH
jgi:hypothetical protein